MDNRIMRFVSILWMLIIASSMFAQQREGRVVEEVDGKYMPLEFVNVYWANTNTSTFTDSAGYFSIDQSEETNMLVFSYVGYVNDTIEIRDDDFITVVLTGGEVLDEVEVTYRQRGTRTSVIDPMLVQEISEKELFKAACCNLSESFETNPSIDVSFSDAVTGAKEIQMLGLSGKYAMIGQEFMPGVRGLAIPFGLQYIPGQWIESIQVTKGAGSIVNGFESMTGQINVELKKPEDMRPLFINGYANVGGRIEANAGGSIEVSEGLSTSILGHFSEFTWESNDRNDDGFLDIPFGTFFTLANRWKINWSDNWIGQLGLKYLKDDRTGGTLPGNEGALYRITRSAERFELWGKTGIIFPEKPYKSIGFQWSFINHDQRSSFDSRLEGRGYDGTQKTGYANLIYQSIIDNTNNTIKIGASYMYDEYDEEFLGYDELLIERVPGAFFEYTRKSGEAFTAVVGLRTDYHNLYDFMITPRVHLRYMPVEGTVIRTSAGRGFRTPHAMAEHLSRLANNRALRFGLPTSTDRSVPLTQEKSWNIGLSVSQNFMLDYREGTITVDYFYTDFQDKLIVDMDTEGGATYLYNMVNDAYAHSFQLEVAYELLKRLDFKVAYRRYDIQEGYVDGTRQMAFNARDRGFLSLDYETVKGDNGRQWTFNTTLQYIGTQRLPDADWYPDAIRYETQTPDYAVVNAQVTHRFSDAFHLYVGGENILDYRQDNPIISAEDPSSDFFAADVVWAPIFGRNLYVGFRYFME